MKLAVATALWILALAAVTPSSAADVVPGCYGCNSAPMRSYGSAAVAQATPDAAANALDSERSYAPTGEQNEPPAPEPSYQSAPEPPYRPAVEPPPRRPSAERSYGPPVERTYRPVPARHYRPLPVRSHRPCAGCEKPRKRYDSVEAIKTHRDIDRSRVINTKSVVPIVRYARPVVRVPAVTVVEYVVHRYYVVDRPLTYTYQVPVYRRPHPIYHRAPHCRRGYDGRCYRLLRVRG